jgi:erythromycin esterase
MVKQALSQVYPSLEMWIRSEALPVDMQSSETFARSIDTFVSRLDTSVEILGLGEALHGGEAILQFRNRLFQRLVEQHGYSAIAIESSFPRSGIANDFITGNNSLAYDAIQDSGFSHGFGRFTGNRDLLEWMRQYNANLANTQKIHFYGFDAPTDMSADSPRHLLNFVLDYFSSVDSLEADRHREGIEALLGDDSRWENPEIAMNPSLGHGLSTEAMVLRIDTENLISALQERSPELIAAKGLESFKEAMHFAVQARQMLNYHAVLATPSSKRQGHLLSIRAVMMLDNLNYIVSRERPRGKVLVFAHNTHLQRSKVEWQFGAEQVHWWPVGAHLDVLFASRYATIASAVGSSPQNGIADAEANSLEALLSENEASVSLVPSHRGQGIPDEALNTLSPRSGSLTNRTYSPLSAKAIKDFDWLLSFR